MIVIKCDKCGKSIRNDHYGRFIDQYGQVDLCKNCEDEITELLDKTETEWFEKGRKE